MNDSAEYASRLQRVQSLGKLMDSSIRLPGGYRIGWDGIIGLIPGVGDAAGAVISLYIVFVAYRSGASRLTLSRMLGNVALESLVGLIPIAGDIFDFVFKANTRNLTLLNTQVDKPDTLERSNRLLLWAGVLGVLATIALALFASVAVIGGLWRLLT